MFSFINREEVVVCAPIAKGGDVDAKNRHGSTTLYCASLYGKATMVEMLLAAGTDVNIKDGNVYMVLHWASPKGHTDVVAVLIVTGAGVRT